MFASYQLSVLTDKFFIPVDCTEESQSCEHNI